MTVLVTGSTGRLGPRLVEHLLAEGRPVRILTRRPFRADRLFAGRADVHEWHPGCEEVPAAAVAGVEAAVHMMGEPFAGPATALNLERIRASRVLSTSKLVAALAGRPVRLVALSLAVPPPELPAGAEMTEATPPAARPTPFAADLLAAEAAALAGAEKGLSVAAVRLGLVLAPGEPWRRLVTLARLGLALPLAGARIPVIDADDAAAMLAGLLHRRDIAGVVYGVGPEPLAGAALVARLARLRKLPVGCPLPGAVAARLLGPLAPVLACRVRIVPRRLLEAGAQFAGADPLPGLERTLAAIVGEAADAGAASVLRGALRPPAHRPAPTVADPADPVGRER